MRVSAVSLLLFASLAAASYSNGTNNVYSDASLGAQAWTWQAPFSDSVSTSTLFDQSSAVVFVLQSSSLIPVRLRPNDTVSAVDILTGKSLFKLMLPLYPSYTTMVMGANGHLYLLGRYSEFGALYSLSVDRDGRTSSPALLDQTPDQFPAFCVGSDGVRYFTGNNKQLWLLKPSDDQLKPVWKLQLTSPLSYTSSVCSVVSSGTTYFVTERARVLEVSSGGVLLNPNSQSNINHRTSAPAIFGDIIYLAADDGAYFVATDQNSTREYNGMAWTSYATFVVSQSGLAVSFTYDHFKSRGTLFALQGGSTEPVWETAIDTRYLGRAVIDDNQSLLFVNNAGGVSGFAVYDLVTGAKVAGIQFGGTSDLLWLYNDVALTVNNGYNGNPFAINAVPR